MRHRTSLPRQGSKIGHPETSMEKIHTIELTPGLAALIGFARKARQVEAGFEAVRRAIEKQKIAFVLVDESLAENSFKKILAATHQRQTPLLRVRKGKDISLLKLSGNKILGLHHGGLAKGFWDKLNRSVNV